MGHSMRNRKLSLFLLASVGAMFLPDVWAAQAFKSGPAVGQIHGGTILPYTVNGRKGKERFHCPVVEFDTKPVVAIFIREGPESSDAVLQELFKKVDSALEKHQETYLGGFAVFVTPDARTSLTQKTEDNDTLVGEAKAREKLLKRLREMAQPLKHLIVGATPEDNDRLKRWNLNAKQPGVTVVFYAKHKVLDNAAFAEGKLRNEDIEQVVTKIDGLLKKARELPGAKK
jgi:hypothetical protein